ncbi:hypothetical protein TELCIR_07012 [Teladorsagia circumcincta]|uniref:Uncharacterized protein n=1 Tax=Teladorsagia circumcincta TaxID=45464 RepID=A0A2G9ULH1_TELCI|nr:hypothetical protein TELCIR_07012 [Teladorsagia circumcincta]
MLRYFTFIYLILLQAVLTYSQEVQNVPFYNHPQSEVPLINRIQIADYQGNANGDPGNGIDAVKIIGPFMSPFMDMFEVMQQKVKARAYMDKIDRDREDSPLSSSRSLFEIVERLQKPTTTTTPQPPLLERLLRPYIEPWQKQLDELSKEMTGITIIPTSSTTSTTPPTTTTSPQNIIEKSLRMFFPYFDNKKQNSQSTTASPKLSDASMFEKLFFSRSKRDTRKKRQALPVLPPLPPPTPEFLNPLRELEKPILELANPFTPNPLMSLFTVKPLPELPPVEKSKLLDMPLPQNPFPEPQFKLQDPFYNPLYPNRKSKFFDLLAGGEATRLLG